MQIEKAPQTPQTDRETSGNELKKPSSSKALKILAIVCVACLLLGIAILVAYRQRLFRHRPVTPTALVVVTDTGFSPATLLVKDGTQITWRNDSKQVKVVAVDPHPNHNSLSGFGGEHSLKPGDSISYTFETTGGYGFHEESQPYSALSTIEVTKN